MSCSVCMVANDADKEKCVCCEEPKPGLAVKKDTKTTSNLLGTIAPGGGFKFGVSSTEPPSTGQSNSGFNFGTSSTISNSSQGFKFGVNSTTTNTAGNFIEIDIIRLLIGYIQNISALLL